MQLNDKSLKASKSLYLVLYLIIGVVLYFRFRAGPGWLMLGEYETNLSSMVTHYHSYLRVLKYLRNAWLNPHKERFVVVWMNKVMHFENVTINR